MCLVRAKDLGPVSKRVWMSIVRRCIRACSPPDPRLVRLVLRSVPLTLLLAAPLAAPLTPATAQDLLWVRQTGSAGLDQAMSVAINSAGNAYTGGYTDGTLGGNVGGNPGGPNAGGYDIALIKYSASGTPLWTRQIGSAADDLAYGVAVDSAGNVYITGNTRGNLGGPNAGGSDIFLAKYNPAGTLLWMRQAGSAGFEFTYGVSTDGAGNAYITGYTTGSLGGPNAGAGDIFLAKYDASGTLLWMRQTGSASGDVASGVSVDSAGNAYIAGETYGNLGGPNAGNRDIILAKYDAAGTLLWTRQLGTAGTDLAESVAADNTGNVYITGFTYGNLAGPNAGLDDIFLAKYSASGTLLWIRQTGTVGEDGAQSVAVDDSGNAYISGYTTGNLGRQGLGSYDVFLAKYDASGNQVWIRQTGTAEFEYATGVAVAAGGNAYITGATYGNLGGPNAGSADSFVARYGVLPCSTLADIAGGGPGGQAGDGIIDGSDFIAFINSFAAGDVNIDPRADVAGGGLAGLDPDGIIDGSDFIAFINAFAAGC